MLRGTFLSERDSAPLPPRPESQTLRERSVVSEAPKQPPAMNPTWGQEQDFFPLHLHREDFFLMKERGAGHHHTCFGGSCVRKKTEQWTDPAGKHLKFFLCTPIPRQPTCQSATTGQCTQTAPVGTVSSAGSTAGRVPAGRHQRPSRASLRRWHTAVGSSHRGLSRLLLLNSGLTGRSQPRRVCPRRKEHGDFSGNEDTFLSLSLDFQRSDSVQNDVL